MQPPGQLQTGWQLWLTQPSPEPQLTHCWPPKPQKLELVPARQVVPVMQPLQHAPLTHAPPEQGVPVGSFALSTHVATLLAPPGHAVMPVLHSPGFVVQVLPGTQLMHAPPEQPFAHVVSENPELHMPPLQVPAP